MIIDFLYGLVGSFLVAFPAWIKHKLSLSGMISAVMLGTLLFGFGSIWLWSTMIVFFLSSTIISSKSKRKKEAKGRTVIQVLANGGIALVSAFIYWLTQVDGWLFIALGLFVGATADTWGSEIGSKRQGKTWDIATWKRVPPGLSGGISLIGTLASVMGSALLSGFIIVSKTLFQITGSINPNPWVEFLFLFLLGLMTSLIDSYLGSLVQAKYQTEQSALLLDSKPEQKAQLVSGLAVINNDAVNFLSMVMVMILAMLILGL